MIIEVCGTGCPRCYTTEKNTLEALKHLGKQAGDDLQVIKITDIKEIGARGVMMTPALLINGVKKCEGRIPSPKEVKKWVEEA